MENKLFVPREAGKVLRALQECPGVSLLALYLHGSAVSGGLRPQSDLDLLAVIDQPLPRPERAALLKKLLEISRASAAPGAGRPVELIVFLASELAAPGYPARCEFMYGEWLRADFAAGQMPEALRDPELTLVLAQARQQARSLFGPAAERLLPEIAPTEARRAMRDALPALLGSLAGDERNVILTLARMWRTAGCGDFVSKEEAARWAAGRLPSGPAEMVKLAQAGYLGERRDDWSAYRKEARETAGLLQALLLEALDRPHPGGSDGL